MAPIKFDDKLREKLEERTITPSEMTWDKLDGELDKLKKKKNNKPFWWLGLAASFVGVLLITNLFFESDNTDQQTIVDTNIKTETKADSKKEIQKTPVLKTVETNTTLANSSKEEQKSTKETNSINTPITVKQKTQRVATVIKKEAPVKANKTIKNNVPVTKTKFERGLKTEAVAVIEKQSIVNFETQKINEVVAQIQELKASKLNVTEAEIDSLLNKAERDIFKKRFKDNSTRVVDANSLLFEVESELEQSFRERVFETIKSGYKTVRTAVVERKNN